MDRMGAGNPDSCAHPLGGRGLLTRARLRFVAGKRTGSESARSDLDEAWEIAERGSMKLVMADIHLYRARLLDGARTDRPEE